MSSWDFQRFNELLGNKVDFSVVIGRALSGKSFVCSKMSQDLGYKPIDMKAMEEGVKKRLGTDEEPFEGDVPIGEVEKDVLALIQSCNKVKFVFDGFLHKTAS